MPHRSANVYLHLPGSPDRDALRAGLLALQCVPINLAAQPQARQTQLTELCSDPRAWVFFDISTRPLHSTEPVGDGLDAALHNVAQALRPRTVLTRLRHGHVSAAERAWAQSLGFADLVGEFEARPPVTTLCTVLAQVASSLGMPTVPAPELVKYMGAVGVRAQGSPRAVVWQHTGRTAEASAQWLAEHLDIQDRSYHFKTYPACFVGAAAVACLCQAFSLSVPAAVAVGQALGSLGLLHHVTHQHAFADAPLFFRLAVSSQADTVDLGRAWQVLTETAQVAQRMYLGTVYDKCFVGSQAVSALCEQLKLTRHASHLVLHRLAQCGLLTHVVNAQPFIDGNFFYRFTRQEAAAQLLVPRAGGLLPTAGTPARA